MEKSAQEQCTRVHKQITDRPLSDRYTLVNNPLTNKQYSNPGLLTKNGWQLHFKVVTIRKRNIGLSVFQRIKGKGRVFSKYSKCNNVFNNRPCKIYGRQPLKYLKG